MERAGVNSGRALPTGNSWPGTPGEGSGSPADTRCPPGARGRPAREAGRPGPPKRAARRAGSHRVGSGQGPLTSRSQAADRRGRAPGPSPHGPGRSGRSRTGASDRYGAAPRPTPGPLRAARSLTFFGSGFAARRACSFSTTWSADSAAIAVTGAASSPELGSRRVLWLQLRPPCLPRGDGSATGPFRASAKWGVGAAGAGWGGRPAAGPAPTACGCWGPVLCVLPEPRAPGAGAAWPERASASHWSPLGSLASGPRSAEPRPGKPLRCPAKAG